MKHILLCSLLIVALLLLVAAPVFAAPLMQNEPPVFDLQSLLAAFLALGGAAIFVTALVNVGKFFHVVPDGLAGVYTLIVNAVLFLLFVIGKVSGLNVENIDGVLGAIGQLVLMLLPLLGQVVVGFLAHQGLKRLKVPVFGFSYSKG